MVILRELEVGTVVRSQSSLAVNVWNWERPRVSSSGTCLRREAPLPLVILLSLSLGGQGPNTWRILAAPRTLAIQLCTTDKATPWNFLTD